KPAKPPTPDRDWNWTLPAIHGPIQPWISTLARNEDPCESFNELMDNPLDFSAFVLNRLNIDTLTQELLAGLTFELMKCSCKSLQYLHDLRKPLPLLPNSHGRRVIPFDHFINNDLAYLSGGVLSRIYATSVTKTMAADYRHIKWIEDLFPNTMWSQVPIVYEKHALWTSSTRDRRHVASSCSRQADKSQYLGTSSFGCFTADVYKKHCHPKAYGRSSVGRQKLSKEAQPHKPGYVQILSQTKDTKHTPIPEERNHLWMIVREKGAMLAVHLKRGKGEGKLFADDMLTFQADYSTGRLSFWIAQNQGSLAEEVYMTLPPGYFFANDTHAYACPKVIIVWNYYVSMGCLPANLSQLLKIVDSGLHKPTRVVPPIEAALCKLLIVASLFFWKWQQSSLAVGTYTASGNSNLAVGMPCVFYSQQSSPKIDAPSAFKFSRIKSLSREDAFNHPLPWSISNCLDFNACSIVVGTSLEYNDEIKALAPLDRFPSAMFTTGYLHLLDSFFGEYLFGGTPQFDLGGSTCPSDTISTASISCSLPSAEATYATVRKEAAHQSILGATNHESQGIAAGLAATESEGVGLATKGYRHSGGRKNRPTIKEDKTHQKCGNCSKTRHTEDQCFDRVGYPNWWNDGHKKGNKGLRSERGKAPHDSVEDEETDHVSEYSCGKQPSESEIQCNVSKQGTTSADPFGIYHILNRNNVKEKVTKDVSSKEQTFPPGFTSTSVNDKARDEFLNSHQHKSSSHGNSDGMLVERRGNNRPIKIKSGGSILEVMEYLVKIRQTMGYNMEGCSKNLEAIGFVAEFFAYGIREISVYAPQDFSEKKILWDYIAHMIQSWEANVLFLEILMKLDSNIRYLELFLMILLGIRGVLVNGDWIEEPSWCKEDKKNSNEYRFSMQSRLTELDKLFDKGKSTDALAKIRWAIESDENTKYFHGIINKKRSQLGIRGVLVNGDWIEEPSKVKDEFLNRFANPFSKPDGPCMTLDASLFKQISFDQNVDVESNVNYEEIKRAVWDCGTNKSPKPDGFTLEFFRRDSTIINQDVVNAIHKFFASGTFPSGCNSFFITLIPKK
nr:RNA-directed DNA polymerase, eukaryota [Tanacetum cinerariifolium]